MRKTKQVSRQLAEVQRRVERWRKREGGRGSRMPAELWRGATEVARIEGVYAVSRALRIDYNRLKSRVSSEDGSPTRGAVAGPGGSEFGRAAFVELETSQICGGCKTVLELVGRAGDRMRLEVAGGPEVDVVGLTQVFLSQQS
jgi:hypothetical protein